MNTHPTATLHMANGSKIVIELLPEAAPNTVNSFIYAASRGFICLLYTSPSPRDS